VDSLLDSSAVLASPLVRVVDALARAIEGVVVMTGSVDYITDGAARRFMVYKYAYAYTQNYLKHKRIHIDTYACAASFRPVTRCRNCS
jgi:hydroxyethylthiazole kinase-like sugar kinase family protein